MSFCPKCGSQNNDGVAFCAKCGASIGAAAPQPVPQQIPQPVQQPAPQQYVQQPAPQQYAQQPGQQQYAPPPYVRQGPSFFQKLCNTKDITATIDPADIAKGKALSILAYCAVLGYIFFVWLFDSFTNGTFFTLFIFAGVMVAPCIMAKESKYLQYHLSQVFTAFFGVLICMIISGTIVGWIQHAIYWGMYSGSLYSSDTAGMIVSTLVAWFLQIIFMAVPVLVVVAGLMNAAKGKARALPLIGKFRFILDK